jgi:phosphotriesterase-related protein
LSHDRGWYDPGTPARQPQPFTYLCETFIPKMRAAGMDDDTIQHLTHHNPFRAFAR